MAPFLTENDPIVVVGMGCRLPGEIMCPSDYWNALIEQKSMHSSVPTNRFTIDKWYHPDQKRNGSITGLGGYFLSQDDSYRQFDPSFFGIHPLEAASMDPQQRKLLEVVYETFESAGATLADISGSQTACFVGAFTQDFRKIVQRDSEGYVPHQSTGSDMTILSNRINYVFNLQGPSFTVDTACSSSTYALHIACQGLHLGDFDAAVVAGTNILMDFHQQTVTTKLGILSPTSTCHTFDISADGIGRGEGITAVYIKRMSTAIANQDPIRAVIRGTAINTNGRGVGISSPGLQGQERVIRQAYTKARLAFDGTAYLECHGTGTQAGDSIETAAAARVFASGRSPDKPILLSGVKSQIGHTEPCSGIASLIKVVMSLEQGIIPGTIGIKTLNPALDLGDGKMKIAQKCEIWPQYFPYRRASLNSFGYGGTNAHIIVDAWDSYLGHMLRPQYHNLAGSLDLSQPLLHSWTWSKDSVPPKAKSRTKYILVTSAHNLKTVNNNVNIISRYANRYRLADLAHTLATKRSLMHDRAFVISSSSDEITPDQWTLGAISQRIPTVALVFTGQGAQWPRMGIEMVDQFYIVREAFTVMQRALDKLPERPAWTLYEALSAPPDSSLIMKRVEVSVTLCCAVQIALVDLLRSWGVHPLAVVGHSSGETGAAYCAGFLTQEEAIVTSFYRAYSMTKTAQPGAMLAVGLSGDEAVKHLRGRAVYVGCHNSPQSSTLSGKPVDIDAVEVELRARHIFTRKIKSSGFANHSPLTDRANHYFRQHFHTALPGTRLLAERCSDVAMYSCITGERIYAENVDIEYWGQNISAPVYFHQALTKLLAQQSVDCLIEVGPHSALAGPIRQTLATLDSKTSTAIYLSCLIRGGDGVSNMLRLAGSLFVTGHPVNIHKANSALIATSQEKTPKHIVDLPVYRWNYDQLYWTEQRRSRELNFRKHQHHDLLGSRDTSSTPSSMLWFHELRLKDVPWIGDHKIGTSVVLPAAAYVAMAMEAASQAVSEKKIIPTTFILRDVKIMSAIVFSNEGVETCFELSPDADIDGKPPTFHFKVWTITINSNWTQHAVGMIEIGTDGPSNSVFVKQPSSKPFPELYKIFSRFGLNYGPYFQTLQDVRHCGNSADAKINLSPTKNTVEYESVYVVHPAALDGCLQLAFAALFHSGLNATERSYLPSEIQWLKIWNLPASGSGDIGHVQGEAEIYGLRSVEAGFRLFDGGQLRAEAKVRFASIEGLSTMTKEDIAEPYQQLMWLVDVDHVEDCFDVSKVAREAVVKAKHDIFPNIQALHEVTRMIALKDPDQRFLVLDLGVTLSSENLAAVLNATRATSRFPAYRNLTLAHNALYTIDPKVMAFDEFRNFQIKRIDTSQDLADQGLLMDSFDVVILTALSSTSDLRYWLSQARNLMTERGYLVLTINKICNAMPDILNDKGLGEGLHLHFFTSDVSVAMARHFSNSGAEQDFGNAPILKNIWAVYDGGSVKWLDGLISAATNYRLLVNPIDLRDITCLPKGSNVISLIETENPFLCHMDDSKLGRLQFLFREASSIIWVTSGLNPELRIMEGLAKTIRAEHPSLQLQCIHIEEYTCDITRVIGSILHLAHNVDQKAGSDSTEQNIWLRHNQHWISRYTIDEVSNKNHVRLSKGIIEYGVFEPGLRLDMRRIGHPTSFFFRPKASETRTSREMNVIKISPVIYSISRSNAKTLKGLISGRYFSCACLGRVTNAPPNSQFAAGDFVISASASGIDSDLTSLEEACIHCKSEDEGLTLVGLVEPFVVAYHAIVELGKASQGTSILLVTSDELLLKVCTALSQFVQASLSHSNGAFLEDEGSRSTTVIGTSQADKFDIVFCAEGNFNAARLNKYSHQASISIQKSETGWFISRGMSSAVMPVNALHGFRAFNVERIVTDNQTIIAKVLEPLRSQAPLRLFDLTEFSVAVGTALTDDNSLPVGLRCNQTSRVPIYRFGESTVTFSAEGAYLLVGCLGGLGRSLSLWMKERGARYFIFMSPSGEDKPEAAAHVRLLCKDPNVKVQVIKGDVARREDVSRAVSHAKPLKIKGVVNAAVTFHDCRFDQLTPEAFNSVLRPKVDGTLNLHHETLGEPLDFFVMTSSTLGIIGPQTQAPYSAANAFLDSMSRYRHQNGLPSTTLSLGMIVGVGHVQNTEGLEDVLTRRGGYGISETEFLHIFERGCNNMRTSHVQSALELPDRSTIVVGLDPTKLAALPFIPEGVKNDRRLWHIMHAIRQIAPDVCSSTSIEGSPAHVRALLATEGTSKLVLDAAVKSCVLQKLGSLILIEVKKLEESLHQPLRDLGMDSISGAEFQVWVWRELSVKMDFMETFGDTQRSLNSFVELISTRAMSAQ